MRKLFLSSFFILTVTAILFGAIGALFSGVWDFGPPAEGVYSYGNYLDGIRFGGIIAIMGLIPYWAFHLFVGDAFYQWEDVNKKPLRVAWVVCWAGFLSFFLSCGLAV